MKFTYRWGQRPLDGYTIKRGLGQGGFGEVYFAVSDGGKEVALKLLLRGRTDTELRGIANCLNFKHPNLVHLYDLQTDERGDHWLVMEYVHGEPLNHVLNRNTKGLPPEQARDWFLQVAKAVSYLHDHAVIHRDTTAYGEILRGAPHQLDAGPADEAVPAGAEGPRRARPQAQAPSHQRHPEKAASMYIDNLKARLADPPGHACAQVLAAQRPRCRLH